jgi:hypothetical protein
MVEFAVAGAICAELAQVFAFGVELLDAGIVAVIDPDVARGVDRDPMGVVLRYA